jgi:succinate dehydrogenase/fumarate reductase cytochrome b subunit
MKIYLCGGKMFESEAEAIAYANFIHRISGFIIAVEEFRHG